MADPFFVSAAINRKNRLFQPASRFLVFASYQMGVDVQGDG